MKKWIALIPAYEPETVLIDLLDELGQSGFDSVVVDDGSGQRYAELFQRLEAYAVVLSHSRNRGKGCALKTGMSYIQENYEESCIVVTLDADGQHNVSDVVKVCEAAQRYPDALVLGSRGFQENVPLRSQFGNVATRLVYWMSTGRWIHDTQTGLRAFSGRLLFEFVDIHGERYEYEMNVLLECVHRQIPVEEIEIETIYINENLGSHFNVLRDSCRIYKEIIRFSASSIVGFLVDYALYSLLLILTAGMDSIVSLRISNIGARIVSGSVNYMLNRSLVFQSKSSLGKSVMQYVVLAAAILCGNTLVLGWFVKDFGMNQFVAKPCTEILFFLLSWLVQRCFIFRNGGKRLV